MDDRMKPARIRWRCRRCRRVQDVELPPNGGEIPCRACGWTWTAPPMERMGRVCPVCRRSELYRRKDFHPGLGLVIVGVAAVLAWWTYGLSLAIAVAVDFWLHRRLGDVGVCYACGAQLRDDPRVGDLEGFILWKHDKYRSRAREAEAGAAAGSDGRPSKSDSEGRS